MESIERLHPMHSNKDKTVVGLYYPNGVFQEDNTNRGISIIADHILFHELCSKITDSGMGYVRGFTHHGYSNFLIISTPDKAFDCYSQAQEVLQHLNIWHHYDLEYLRNWIYERSLYYSRVPLRLESLYYQKRIPNSPLSKSLFSEVSSIPNAEEIERWVRPYVDANRIAVTTSGALTDQLCMLNINPYKTSCIPKLRPERLNIPKHMPWKFSNIIVSIPCCLDISQTLVCEALCQWLSPHIKAAVNSVGGKFISAQVCSDYVNEYRFSIQAPRGTEKRITEKIVETISTKKPDNKKEIASAKANLNRSFTTLFLDYEEWNRFCGYNAISGSNYQPDQLLNQSAYDQMITQATLEHMLAQMKEQIDQLSVFVAPIR